jgi:glycosyltransferase involved in cell wall biosynthesis
MPGRLVSVVVPTYNRARVIAETLDSILAQTYPHLEVVVVDDGSTDDTEAVVAPYRDRVTYLRQQNQGLAGARNLGFQTSTGDYVAWLDSDDLWNRDKLALQVAVLDRHPEVAVVASDFSAFDVDGYFEQSHASSYYSVLGRTPGGLAGIFSSQHLLPTRDLAFVSPDVPDAVRVYEGEIYAQLVDGNFLHPPTVIYRREAGLRAGHLDGAFRRDSDYEYFLRLSREGRVAYVDLPLMRYRYSDDQMSSDKHLADIALSRVLVLESLEERDVALGAKPGFRQRLGYSHLALAHALADAHRVPSVRHLLKSLRCGFVGGDTARTVAKLCLPQWVVQAYRRYKIVLLLLLNLAKLGGDCIGVEYDLAALTD